MVILVKNDNERERERIGYLWFEWSPLQHVVGQAGIEAALCWFWDLKPSILALEEACNLLQPLLHISLSPCLLSSSQLSLPAIKNWNQIIRKIVKSVNCIVIPDLYFSFTFSSCPLNYFIWVYNIFILFYFHP